LFYSNFSALSRSWSIVRMQGHRSLWDNGHIPPKIGLGLGYKTSQKLEKAKITVYAVA